MKDVPSNLSNLKSKLEELDVDELAPVPVDLSELSDLIKNKVVKKDVYNAKTKNIEDKIPDINNLPTTTTTLNAKINGVKKEIHSINDLATNTVVNTKTNEVKYKISNITNLANTAANTTQK